MGPPFLSSFEGPLPTISRQVAPPTRILILITFEIHHKASGMKAIRNAAIHGFSHPWKKRALEPCTTAKMQIANFPSEIAKSVLAGVELLRAFCIHCVFHACIHKNHVGERKDTRAIIFPCLLRPGICTWFTYKDCRKAIEVTSRRSPLSFGIFSGIEYTLALKSRLIANWEVRYGQLWSP